MLEKLKEIEEKFIGIESELAKPEVVSDSNPRPTGYEPVALTN